MGQPTATFTDSGLTWRAADPAYNRAPYLPTYEKMSPTQLQGLLGLSALDSAHPYVGSYDDPLADAVLYGPTDAKNDLDAVASLMPKDMALGQVVPWEIEVDGSVAGASGVIDVNAYWLTKTTNGGDFGFDPNWGVIGAFVDTGDAFHADSGTSASADIIAQDVINDGEQNEQITAKVRISGLQSTDKIVVELWVVLKSTIADSVTGNVQTGLSSAATAEGADIQLGTQNVSLMQVHDFYTNDADISITKDDSPDPIAGGQTLTYTMVVKNNNVLGGPVANGVALTDTLDPARHSWRIQSRSMASLSPYTLTGDSLSIPVGALMPQESKTVTFQVTVDNVDPRSARGPLSPAGTAEAYDRIDTAVVSALNSDPNTGNNTASAYTNVFNPKPSVPVITVTKTAGVTSVNEPGGFVTYMVTVENYAGQSVESTTSAMTSSVRSTPRRASRSRLLRMAKPATRRPSRSAARWKATPATSTRTRSPQRARTLGTRNVRRPMTRWSRFWTSPRRSLSPRPPTRPPSRRPAAT